MNKMNEEQVEELVSGVREFNEQVAETVANLEWEQIEGRSIDTASRSSVMLASYGTSMLTGAVVLMDKGCPPHIVLHTLRSIRNEVEGILRIRTKS